MSRWRHECSLSWLQARNGYLTASDAHKLVPYTDTGRRRKVSDEDYEKLAMAKMRQVSPEHCVSTGAAARGHLLEPYAVMRWNEEHGGGYRHWDDVLIPSRTVPYAAWSPDALDVAMSEPGPVCSGNYTGRRMLEVKCYGPDKHDAACLSSKMERPERWQIAFAMLCSDIVEGTLVLYDPTTSCKPLHGFAYTQADLADEIDELRKVAGKWGGIYEKVKSMSSYPPRWWCDEVDAKLDCDDTMNPV